MIQNIVRKHMVQTPQKRELRRELRRKRKEAASAIQGHWRSFDRGKNEGRASLRDYYRAQESAAQERLPTVEKQRDLDGLHRAQLALDGAYKRVEQLWTRSAICIQRAVRGHLLCLDEAEVKRIGVEQRVLTPVRGTVSEGTRVSNASYAQL